MVAYTLYDYPIAIFVRQEENDAAVRFTNPHSVIIGSRVGVKNLTFKCDRNKVKLIDSAPPPPSTSLAISEDNCIDNNSTSDGEFIDLPRNAGESTDLPRNADEFKSLKPLKFDKSKVFMVPGLKKNKPVFLKTGTPYYITQNPELVSQFVWFLKLVCAFLYLCFSTRYIFSFSEM